MPVDLSTVTAGAVLARLASGELSSSELLEATLARIEEWNPAVNAVVALDAERARAQARSADAAFAAGRRTGPLHGLPMTVKDAFETARLRTTSGATELAGHVPERDAEAVARLRGAGAIILGKTNVPRYAGDFQTYNDVYGLTRNPWRLDVTAGGSSGGSAVAVATGMSLLELGSDIAGSIRAPAHYCGVCGHLPSFAAVPMRGHIPGAPGSLAAPALGVAGPLSRCVADLELALPVLVGDHLAGVPGGRLPPAAPALRRLRGCRIGVWLDNPLVRTDREVLGILRGLVEALRREGAAVVDRLRAPRPFYEMHETYLLMLFGTLSAGFTDAEYGELAIMAGRDDAGPGGLLARAVTQSYRQWLSTQERQARVEAAWNDVFAAVDVVLTPVTPVPAFPHDIDGPPVERELMVNGRAVAYFGHTVWTNLASLGRLPATVVPVARTAGGLPVGVQILGPRFADLGTLAFARLVEELTGGFTAPPPLVASQALA